MTGRLSTRGVLAVALCVIFAASAFAQYPGFDIPAGGKDEKSPLTATADVVQRGKVLFAANCARCHGPAGKGNGPESDHAADLTDEFRFQMNTEGVLFYKVWNGHAIQLRTEVDDMPAFRDKLTRKDVWSLVEYVKALRAPAR